MHFVDQASIHVAAGNGGHGVISFRREKYVPKGGPDGGNGGKGGSIYLEADPQLSTLLDFRYRLKYEAENGRNGAKNNCTGRNGKDLTIRVPVGTLVTNALTGDVLADLVTPYEKVVLAMGGHGGLGNAEFKSATHQAPRHQTNGGDGEKFDIQLELKLLADVALVGFPNAGKSTFISRVSAAKPKIADYPFTTLVPNLGIVAAPEEHQSFVVADIPGLIEGASQGKGLGHQFLRHIERTSVLLFLLDGADTEQGPKEAYKVLSAELKNYEASMMRKEKIIAITKFDALTDEQIKEYKKMKLGGVKPMLISAVSGHNVAETVASLWQMISERRRSFAERVEVAGQVEAGGQIEAADVPSDSSQQ